MVAAIAVLAFFATLIWPLADAVPFTDVRDPGAGRSRSVVRETDLTCAVAYVNDGDTLRCRGGVRIRLHAVAARERDGSCSPGHPCPSASAEAATAELRRLAQGRTLRCRSTGRSYDRITAICWAPDGEEINCAMVRSGVALIWDRFDRKDPLCQV